jgi:hypothetical protein
MKELNIQKIQNKLRNKFLASGVEYALAQKQFFFLMILKLEKM